MALTDNATNGRIVKEAYGRGKLTLTAACEMGDLLTKAGALADGNSGANKADWVALEKAASGVAIGVAKMVVIGGLTGATLGDTVYLSDTAGGYSATVGTVEQIVGQALSATDILVMPIWTPLQQNHPDDVVESWGDSNDVKVSWDTTDANANALLVQLPAGGAVNVPVIVIGQSIESVDLGLYNGVVDPRIAMFGVGAVTTAPIFEFRKARGTVTSPTVVTTGDDLGTLDFYGAVAAGEYVRAASIRVDMAGTIATTRGPGTITFLTATDAAPSVLTQALLISAAQLVTAASLTSTGAFTASSTSALNGVVTVADDILLGIGGGNAARLSWDTTDANANALLLQMPVGGAVDVPLLAIGQSVESVDLGLYDGLVDPRVVMFGVGAVATGPGFDFRKARGTIASPTVVTTGDDLGTIRAYGAVAAGEYVQAAEIRFDMAGTIATTRGPGTITFLTATDAAPSVLTQALIISAAQKLTAAAGMALTTGHFEAVAGTLDIQDGGAVTQGTSKSTGVTLSTYTGQITMHNAALAADAIVSFTLTNTVIGANDIVVLQHHSVGTVGSYVLTAQPGAGSCVINVANRSAGSLSDAIVISFAVIKAAVT